MKELILKKCLSCGALVEVIKDCNCPDCGIQCCGKAMTVVKPNSVDAAFEKHVPTYEVNENTITVRVNHVMEEEHYIEWIAISNDREVCKKFLKPGEEPVAIFPYVIGSTIYSYCNKHSLWSAKVK